MRESMGFGLSRCVGLTAPHPDAMVQKYRDALGWEMLTSDQGLCLTDGALRAYVDPGERRPPVLELLTDHLSAARGQLRALGFEEVTWKGSGELNLVVDPFGNSWNIFELGADDEDEDFDFDSPTLARIGLHTHEPAKVAEFFSTVLERPATLSGHVWVIDSDPVRLRIEPGLPNGPVFLLEDSLQLQALGSQPGQSTLTDTWGITWRVLPRPPASTAVISEAPHA